MTLKPASSRTKKLALATFIAACLTALLALATGVSFIADQAADGAVTSEDVSDSVSPKGASLDPAQIQIEGLDLPAETSTSRSVYAMGVTGAAKEGGAWVVAQVRPCGDGMVDVTEAHPAERWFYRELAGSACGTIWEETASNFLADEGESDLLACFYRGASCPTAFTMSLLSTSATPAETSTWAALSANELVTGTSPGYAAAALTRDSTGWATLDTVASGTGGCTETSCGRISTAQVTITSSGTWTVAARYITIRATVSAAQRHVATAQLSADRTLQNGDQLNLTYRQAMQ